MTISNSAKRGLTALAVQPLTALAIRPLTALAVLLLTASAILTSCKRVEPSQPKEPEQKDTTVWHPVAPCAESAIAFLSEYETPEELLAMGDDDEASAWLWFSETYPEAKYLYFGDIHEVSDLESLKVLFWLRDIESGDVEDVFTMPESVAEATPALSEWYRAGGNIVLWGHAVVYVEELGRLPKGTYRSPSHDLIVGCGRGHLDEGHWLMAVQLYPGHTFKKDHSTHPLFEGLPIYENNDIRGIMVKGPGWTEDHNCVFFNYPSEITGRNWEQEICYTLLTDYFGIYPLATWDSQIWWLSQLNVYELRKGQTEYEGRLLCIGNGGCEFSMKSYREVGKDEQGNPVFETVDDRCACPTNNIYQANILRMAKNAVEYLRIKE